MIQRIQTLYILASFVLSTVCIYLEITAENHPWALTVIMAIAAVLQFMAIFMFRRGAAQMRFCTFCIILMVAWYAVYAAFAFVFGDGLVGEFRPRPWAAIPMVNAILLYLAFRAILKDELLVRSQDRLR